LLDATRKPRILPLAMNAAVANPNACFWQASPASPDARDGKRDEAHSTPPPLVLDAALIHPGGVLVFVLLLIVVLLIPVACGPPF
jgi:hypothetical protein